MRSSLTRLALGLVVPCIPAVGQDPPVVRVFILAGQSNMEGKAQNALFEHQAADPATAELFTHLRDEDGWLVRDDVFVKFLDRRGGLTIGFGSPDRTGVELEFGTVLGDRFEEPVLLIKTAWGGHSLFKMFRSPSAGLPGDDDLARELAEAQARVRDHNDKESRDDPLPTLDEIRGGYGESYREMLAEIRSVVGDVGKWFPELAGHRPELSGFVWFQGWNDQYGGAEIHYASNLTHLIRDVRRDLGVPEMPFVIGVMGQNGSEPATGAMQVIQAAQLAVAELPEFRGKVVAVRTDELVDKAAEALYPTWSDHVEEWNRVGSDHPYHYLGSAIWHLRMGRAFGAAMVGMSGGD